MEASSYRTLKDQTAKSDKVKEDVIKLINELSPDNKYAIEEVASEYCYPSKYLPRKIIDQVVSLRQLFPGLASVDLSWADRKLPPGAEAYFAIPRWEKIAPTYNAAVEKVLESIERTYQGNFHNYRANQLGPNRLRQHERSMEMWDQQTRAQNGADILVVPAQFGMLHRGRSVRRAREKMQANEFGLGTFEVGIMILTHPRRLNSYDDLWIDCAGDEYDYTDVYDWFSGAPVFNFDNIRIEFGADWCGNVYAGCGSASGFVST